MKALEQRHPFVILFYFAMIISLTMLTLNPILIILTFIGSIGFVVSLFGIKHALKSLAYSLILLIILAITNPIFVSKGETVLFFLNGQPFTLEAILYGLAAASTLISIFYWFKSYNDVMSSDKFIYLFGKIIPTLSLIISMAFSLVPKFKKQYKAIDDSQKALGIYTTKSFADRIKNRLRIFSILLTWGLENSIDTAQSMRARGYGLKGRTSFSLFYWRRKDTITIIFLSLIFGALWMFYFKGDLSFSYYPVIKQISFELKNIIIYSLWFITTTYPIIIEAKEKIKWRYLQSKI